MVAREGRHQVPKQVGARPMSPTSIDPVCSMPVSPDVAISTVYGGTELHFCSDFCRREFLLHPRAYVHHERGALRQVRPGERRVAYFSMEVALDPRMHTFSGGLGVLAGDTLRSFADLEVPVIAVSLVHRRGYFKQVLTERGQEELADDWPLEGLARRLPTTVQVQLESRTVEIAAWSLDVEGATGFPVPLVLLDADVAGNAPEDRRLTDSLYGGDDRYRLAQEIILGVGGVRMLAALGYTGIRCLHLNEGHSALAPLELLRTEQEAAPDAWDFAAVRAKTIFTTHTPIAAGHDRFPPDLVRRVLGAFVPEEVFRMVRGGEWLNMTVLALNLSHYVNGVARRHQEVTETMFPHYGIHQITNGVHSATWTSPPVASLFDREIPGWRNDPFMLRNATRLSGDDLWRAHAEAKTRLLERVRSETSRALHADCFTIGFARRSTAYKRAALVLSDPARLRALAAGRGLQLVFAGKAHPHDAPGKQILADLLARARELGADVPVVYLANYDIDVARDVVAGVDLWLNTPLRPLEASGTSGMKAAHNGVPSMSTLDGWWLEGHVEGVTGWSIGSKEVILEEEANRSDAADLYEKLERRVLPLYYADREGWMTVMRNAIALNASFFNTHRMVRQYVQHAYEL